MRVQFLVAAVVALFAARVTQAQADPPGGQLRAWGANDYGQIDVPADLGPVQDAFGGFLHTVALDADGYVHAWGAGEVDPPTNVAPEYGQSILPANLGRAIRVGAGYYHSIAQMPNGTLRLWGNNASGQCAVPNDLVVTDFAGGGFHTVVLLPDGTVRCFGAGQVSPPTNQQPEYGQGIVPAIVSSTTAPGFVRVVQVTAGLYFTAVLREDGSVIAWGDNLYGQCTPPADLGPAAKISAGRSHCMALLRNGSVRVWGGFTNNGENTLLGAVPLDFAVDIAAGFRCNVALNADGDVYVWGSPAQSEQAKLNAPSDLGAADRVWGLGRHLLARIAVTPRATDCNDDGLPDQLQCLDGSLPDYDLDGVPDCCERNEPCVVGFYPLPWRDSAGGNGHWYQVVATPTQIDFRSASLIAAARGGHLFTGCGSEFDAVIELTRAMSPTMWQAVGQSEWAGPWIGLRLVEGSWNWIDGTTTCAFDRWDSSMGQPDSPRLGDESVALLYTVGPQPLPVVHDAMSFATTRSLIIEWSADCNGDGIVDYGQILQGQLTDKDNNGVPDSCESDACIADITRNGVVDGVDLAAVLGAWDTSGQGQFDCDITNDGLVDGQDLAFVLGGWGPCP